ncbi:MAG: hypothetical protein AAGC60_21750 [Acidobacteriota bacterium]
MNSAALSVLEEEGVHGPEAETSLRRVLAVLAAQSRELRRHLDELGLRIEDVDPTLARTTQIVRRLHDAGLDKARSRLLFGHRGAKAISTLMRRIERLEELEDES